MAKSDNGMTEDDLLSALGIAPEEPQQAKSAPPVLDSDLLVDVFVGGGAPKKPSSSSRATVRRSGSHSAEREAQLKEKSIRASEWKRELEEQQERNSVFTSRPHSADTSKSQDVVRVKAQPIIPNSADMEDIEEIAVAASQKQRAAEQIEHRRQAMQAQIRHQQAEVARQAKIAEEESKKRQQAEAAAKRAQASQQTKAQRRQQAQEQSRANVSPRTEPHRQDAVTKPSITPFTDSRPLVRSSKPFEGRTQAPKQAVLPVKEQETAQPQAEPKKSRRQKREDRVQQQRPMDMNMDSKESPLGIVLIVLAVLCVLVAASLLTGLWDISNL